MKKRTIFLFVQYIVLLIACGLTVFLILSPRDTVPQETSIVFVLDVHRSMNTQDVWSGSLFLSRLQAAKILISTMVIQHPDYLYGLMLLWSGHEYIVPPTFDTGTFFLYLSGVTTNTLPAGSKNFSQLPGLLTDEHIAYVILSDFDAPIPQLTFAPSVTLLGLWSLEGGVVRYSNGIQYYDQWTSVSSMRNDVQASHIDAPYIPMHILDTSVWEHVLFPGYFLSGSLRMILYALLGILVLFALLF